jgi:CheY-like chemotaxis protein
MFSACSPVYVGCVRVLICDDEPAIRKIYRTAFEMGGADAVDEAGDGDECLDLVQTQPYDLVVLDLYMPRRDGLSALPAIKEACPSAEVLVVSAHAGVEIFGQSRSLGATACYEKLGFLQKIPDVISRFPAA